MSASILCWASSDFKASITARAPAALPQVAVDSCLCTPQAKPPELVEAYATGKADYYGLYRRKFAGEDVNL